MSQHRHVPATRQPATNKLPLPTRRQKWLLGITLLVLVIWVAILVTLSVVF
ncbi:MAG: hypothetical protein JW719_13325 [Pirellulales bacterium]|nr:hypothetical protein [Pirellulales bacterium]